MGTTTNHGIRYPEGSNAVAVPSDLKKLADDVDAQMISSDGGTISGDTVFTGEVDVNTPINASNPANKGYVDSQDDLKADKDQIGNLLTDAQASYENGIPTAGSLPGSVNPQHITLSHDPANAAMLATVTNASPHVVYGGNSGLTVGYITVTPGQTITWWAEVSTPDDLQVGAGFRAFVQGAGETGSVDIFADAQTVSSDPGAPTVITVTGVIPEGKNRVSFRCSPRSGSGIVGKTYRIHRAGWWIGAGGDWAPPGQPILNMNVEQPRVVGLADTFAAKADKNKIGNLLTDAQATFAGAAHDASIATCGWTRKGVSGSTTGFSSLTTSLDTTVLIGGLPTIKITPATPGTAFAASISLASTYDLRTAIPVRPRTVYSALMAFRGNANVGASKQNVRLGWYDSAGTYLTHIDGNGVTAPVSGEAWSTVSGVAPDNAAYAAIVGISLTASGIGPIVWMGQPSIHAGPAGTWQPPGVPIPGQSVLPVQTTPVPQAKLWAGTTWAPNPVVIGTGSPLNVVTPDFKGQEYVDTAQTLGARKWVATGTTAASWVVSDGRLEIAPIYLNGWATEGSSYSHYVRNGNQVFVALYVSSGTDDRVCEMPLGFRPRPSTVTGNWCRISGTPEGVARYVHGLTAFELFGASGQTASVMASFAYLTNDPWPTVAPV